jgi:hypothetical protein
VKNLAMFGLGHYIYAKEDAPEGSAPVQNETKKSTAKKPTHLTLEIGDDNWDKVLKYAVANKALGLDAIVKNLSSKYKVTPAVKSEIKKSL